MSRTPDPAIRQEILSAVLASLGRNGLRNLSLRDIAREVGTSARMLIYHFGSYEDLVNAVFVQLSEQHKDYLRAILEQHHAEPLSKIFAAFIGRMFTANYYNTILLFLELYTTALRDVKKYDQFFDAVLHGWIDEVEKLMRERKVKNARTHAVMAVAFYRGLMLDWLATRDNKRILKCSNQFAALLAAATQDMEETTMQKK